LRVFNKPAAIFEDWYKSHITAT